MRHAFVSFLTERGRPGLAATFSAKYTNCSPLATYFRLIQMTARGLSRSTVGQPWPKARQGEPLRHAGLVPATHVALLRKTGSGLARIVFRLQAFHARRWPGRARP